MTEWMFLLALVCLTAVLLLIYANRRCTLKIMDTIERMLDAALEGTYTETAFDESRLSSLESKFAHYLSASTISARHVTKEKDNIKRLIADISHQTKTPIANLLLYSELMTEEDSPTELRAHARSIRQQTQKLHFLIDSLVKLSRLENGILTLCPRKSALQPVLDSILNQYAPQARQKGLTLQVIPTDASADFDRKWTTEALANLVDNAIKYTSFGSVTLSAVEYELLTRIDITDTGMGIPEAEQAKVFSRFYRSQAVREKDGAGIGLYLAREIISGQGGYIRLTSAPGSGSVFSVFLPRHNAQSLQNCQN